MEIVGRSVGVPAGRLSYPLPAVWVGFGTMCRAYRGLAVVWLVRGANARSGIRHARHGFFPYLST